MTDPDEDLDAALSDGTEAATARLLFIGTAAAVVVRGLTWMLSGLTFGPILGLIDWWISSSGIMAVLVLQAVVTALSPPVALWCAVGLRNDPGRFRRLARILSWVFAVDVVVYVVPIVLMVVQYPATSLSRWLLFAFAIIGNAALGWLAVVIARRVRPLRAAPAE
ncbi:MAG TPA: hypothetical protein VFO77_02530 [Actinoplanes sp.]|nr:hypothetical protein [Actinoplanes sp.]